MRVFALSLALATGCEAVPAAHADPAGTTWTLDAAASSLYVQVFKDPSTLGSDLAHDHVVLATGWSGTVRLDPDQPTVCESSITVPVAGLKPDLPELRQKVGYPVMLTDAQQGQVAEHMRGDDQLKASRFPEIRFQSKNCTLTGEQRQVVGTLSVRGVSKDLQFPLDLRVEGDTLRAKGSFSLRHADFGFSPYTAFLGTLRNQEELRFTLDVVGHRR